MDYTIQSPTKIRKDGIYISLRVGTINFNGVYFCNIFALTPDGYFIDEYKPINENLSVDHYDSLSSNLLRWFEELQIQKMRKYRSEYNLIWTPSSLSVFDENSAYPQEMSIYFIDNGDATIEFRAIDKNGPVRLIEVRHYKFVSLEDINKENLHKTSKKLFEKVRPKKRSFFKRLGF